VAYNRGLFPYLFFSFILKIILFLLAKSIDSLTISILLLLVAYKSGFHPSSLFISAPCSSKYFTKSLFSLLLQALNNGVSASILEFFILSFISEEVTYTAFS